MDQKRQYWLLLATTVGFFAAAIPLWIAPSNKEELQQALVGWTVVSMSAMIVCATSTARFWKTVCFLSLTVPAGSCSRIVADVAKDPTSHNLWPLELVFAIIVGFGFALVGATVGALIARIADLLGRD